MHMLKGIALALLLLVGCALPARGGPAVDQDNAMVIDGVIQSTNLSKLESALLAKKDGEVDLVINSPGGSVYTGFKFVSVLEDTRSRGIRINCFVGGMAASMAFQILLHCDERHVLDRSFLLWHRARVMMGGMGGQPMTAPQLGVLSADLNSTDSLIFSEVTKYLGGESLSPEVLRYHFENETMHVGENLGKSLPKAFQSHAAIPGLYEALANKKIPRTEEQRGFGFDMGGTEPSPVIPMRRDTTGSDLSGFEFGEIIYIK